MEEAVSLVDRSIPEKSLFFTPIRLDSHEGNLIVSAESLNVQFNKKGKEIHLEFSWESVLGGVHSSKKPTSFSLLTFEKTNKARKAFKNFTIHCEEPTEVVRIIQSMAFLGRMPNVGEKTYYRRLLIIINPRSGRGRAAKIWRSARPLFKACETQVIHTTHQNHATEIVQEAELSEFDGIVLVSGDGLIHESINALCTRPDHSRARMFPISVIPGGSANCLAKALCEASGIMLSPVHSAFLSIKGKSSPMDVTKLTTVSGKIIYSLINFAWAFIADVDLGSEICRCCGGCRFDMYGAWKLLTLTRYNGTFEYQAEDSELKAISGPFLYFLAHNIPWLTQTSHIAPRCQIDDGFNDLIIMGNRSRIELLGLLLRQDSGRHIDLPNVLYEKTKNWTLKPEGGVFSIDGEAYRAEEVNAEVLNHYASVLIVHET